MKEHTQNPPSVSTPVWDALEAWARNEIQGRLQQVLEEEVTAFLGRYPYQRRADVDPSPGYRNGYGKPRKLGLTCGTVEVRRPRVRGLEARFESRILPLFARRTKEVGDLLPELYLHGLSLGDFELALRGLLGEGAPLSSASISRLRGKWEAEHQCWRSRSLRDRERVYAWADGIYVKAGLEKEKAALLVVIGALSDGSKEVLALQPGYRESTQSWKDVLRDLRTRGLNVPVLLVADGNLGIWAAADEIWPEATQQRCWNHKIINVLDKLPKRVQAHATHLLTQMPYAKTRDRANTLRKRFAAHFQKAYPDAVDTLFRDWDRMVAFYDFPEPHWRHLRTTNVVESPFASVRLRTNVGKRYKKVKNATALIWRVLVVAEKRFRKLQASHLPPGVFAGQKYRDGKPFKQSEKLAA